MPTRNNHSTAEHEAPEVIETTEKKVKQVIKDAADQAGETVEAVEVKVNEVVSNASASSAWLVDGFRRLTLASIGAVAMTFDEAEGLVGRLVERGELAQKDGQKLLKGLQGRLGSPRNVGTTQVDKVSDRLEQGVEEVLTRLNIPSKRDIEDLSARIAQLTARVEELKKK
jgi:poly(hydroxyalkanoate) granule-associated protein